MTAMSLLEHYAAPAGKRTGMWRIPVGILMILAFWLASTVAVMICVVLAHLVISGSDLPGALAGLQALTEGGDPVAILIMLTTFSGVWIGAWLAVRTLHGQSFRTLLAPEGRFRAGEFMGGLMLAAVFSALSITAAVLFVGAPVPAGQSIGTWLLFAIPAVALIFVQATAEELIFRGYLLQQMVVRSTRFVVWAGLPSLLFGAIHYDSSLPDHGGLYYIAVTFVMGLTLAVLVARTGALWAAAGLHVGINAIALCGVGADGILSGTQFFLFPEDKVVDIMRLDLGFAIMMLIYVLSPWSIFPRQSQSDESRSSAALNFSASD